MKKTITKTTTEEFKDGELVKRVIEEIVEENDEKPQYLPINDNLFPKKDEPWKDKVLYRTSVGDIVELSRHK